MNIIMIHLMHDLKRLNYYIITFNEKYIFIDKLLN